MQRSNRLIDFIVLSALVAGGAYFATRRDNAPASPSPIPLATQTARASNGLPERAGPFQLRTSDGRVREFSGQGPLIITLTAIGCGGCINRIPTDKELLAVAQEKNIPLYNVLVFADDNSGKQFVDQYHPSATEILFDPGGKVSVNQYGGSDGNCWMLIAPDGKFLYQGSENMSAMKQALASL